MIEFSNLLKERVKPEAFENRHVNQHFDPKEQFKLMFKGIKILNFVDFPFLLTLDYKNVRGLPTQKLMAVETHVEQQINLHKNMANMMGGVIPAEVLEQGGGMINAIFLHF